MSSSALGKRKQEESNVSMQRLDQATATKALQIDFSPHPPTLATCSLCCGYIHPGVKRAGIPYVGYSHLQCFGRDVLSNNNSSWAANLAQQVHERQDLRISLIGLQRQIQRDGGIAADSMCGFSEGKLDEIVWTMPKTKKELFTGKHRVPRKIQEYAEGILRIVAHYRRKYALEGPPEDQLTWEEQAIKDHPDEFEKNFYERDNGRSGMMYHLVVNKPQPQCQSPSGRAGADDGKYDTYEISPHSKAECRSCRTMIHQGLKRVGKWTKTRRYTTGYYHKYFHVDCFVQGEPDKLATLNLKEEISPDQAIINQVKRREDLAISLNGLRKQIAIDRGCSDGDLSNIFSEKILEQIVQAMPITEEDLSGVDGMSSTMVADFGSAILKVTSYYNDKYASSSKEKRTWEERAEQEHPEEANKEFNQRGLGCAFWYYLLLKKDP